MTGAALAGRLVEALIASALLMLLVLALRRPVRRAFGPEVGYWLWALPLLRLVLPPLPAGWGRTAALPVAQAGEAVTVLVFDAAPAATASAAPQVPLLPLVAGGLAIVWAAGAALFLLRHLVAHRRFCRRIEAGAVEEDVVEGIRLLTSAAAPGPLAFGLFRKTIAFPVDVADRYDVEERALALAHEIGHHRRGDLFANWAALGVLALHWFNPVAWVAFRAFRADQELANDARVLAGRSATQRHLYACAIVKAAHGLSFSAACHLHTVADLKGRLKMLATSRLSRRRLASGAASVAVLAVAGLGLTASANGAAAISAKVQDAVAQAAPPAPPAPPASPAPADPAKAPHRVRKVVIVKDGKTQTYEGAEADAYLAAHPLPEPPTPPEAGKGPHTVRKVMIVRDGKATVADTADIDAHLAAGDRVAIEPLEPGSSRMIVKADGDPTTRIEVQDIPAIRSATCGIGNGKPASMTVETRKGDKRTIVICTDRIERVTADATARAANARGIEHDAYTKALDGLTDARVRIAGNADMSEADRAHALAAIDTSITEMKGQIARGR